MTLVRILLLGSSLWAQGSCLVVDRASVTAGDLAAVLPEFAALPSNRHLLWAPAPGLTRVLKGMDVGQLALRENLDLPATTALCVQRRTVVFPEQQVLEALRERLPAESELRLVEYCRLPLMPGRLRFAPRPSVQRAGKQPESLWRGTVTDDDQRTAPFWAVVQVRVRRFVVRAVRPIPANTIVTTEDVAETVEQIPWADLSPLRLADLVGKETSRPIEAQQVVRRAWLRDPLLIRKGQIVRVTVESGQTRLGLEGRALNGGNLGGTLLVTNGETGRTFRAEVTGLGTAVLRMEVPVR